MKSRINLSYTTILLTFFLCLISCESGNVGRLKSMIKEEKIKLPKKFVNEDKLVEINYDVPSNIVYLTFKVENPGLIDVLEKNKETAVRYFQTLFMNEEWRLPNAIANSKAAVVLNFRGGKEDNENKITLSNDEFSELLLSGKTESQKEKTFLQNMIFIENESCPRDGGQGIQMTSVSLENNQVVVEFEFDENILNASKFKDYLQSVSSIYKVGLQNAIPQHTRKIIKNQNLSIKYLWKGNKGGNPLSLVVKPDEIVVD